MASPKSLDVAQAYAVRLMQHLVVPTFVLNPRRRVVICRRLAKDWENLNRKGLAFLRLASIRLMLRKLCNPA